MAFVLYWSENRTSSPSLRYSSTAPQHVLHHLDSKWSTDVPSQRPPPRGDPGGEPNVPGERGKSPSCCGGSTPKAQFMPSATRRRVTHPKWTKNKVTNFIYWSSIMQTWLIILTVRAVVNTHARCWFGRGYANLCKEEPFTMTQSNTVLQPINHATHTF